MLSANLEQTPRPISAPTGETTQFGVGFKSCVANTSGSLAHKQVQFTATVGIRPAFTINKDGFRNAKTPTNGSFIWLFSFNAAIWIAKKPVRLGQIPTFQAPVLRMNGILALVVTRSQA